MKQQADDFKTTYARLKAWRDAIRASRQSPRPKKTPFSRPFSRKSKPKGGQG